MSLQQTSVLEIPSQDILTVASQTLIQPWTWGTEPRLFTSEEFTARAFYPRMYAVSPSLSSLNTPWFIDYGHLVFWFFFFSTFVIVAWLVYFANAIAHNVEARRPIRETRGFSRAQTGDIMTAVLPMTWSITMLMHASTHSINFDENTAATVFSVTVMAYQWGWNYYFPRDIVAVLTKSPRLVGRNRIDRNQAELTYALLLEQARGEYGQRLTARNLFIDKQGGLSLPSSLGLFVHAPAALHGGAELVSSDLFALAVTEDQRLGVQRKLWQLFLKDTAVGVPASAASSYEGLHLASARAQLFQTSTRGAVVTTTLPFLFSKEKPAVTPVSWLSLVLRPTPLTEGAWAGNAARSPATLFMGGNRLGLIHQHLTSAQQLPTNYVVPSRQAALLRRLLTIQRNVQTFAAVPGWLTPMSTSWTPLSAANLGINLQLTQKSAYHPGAKWHNAFAAIFSSTKELDFFGAPSWRFALPSLAISSETFFQALRLGSFEAATFGGRSAVLTTDDGDTAHSAALAFKASKRALLASHGTTQAWLSSYGYSNAPKHAAYATSTLLDNAAVFQQAHIRSAAFNTFGAALDLFPISALGVQLSAEGLSFSQQAMQTGADAAAITAAMSLPQSSLFSPNAAKLAVDVSVQQRIAAASLTSIASDDAVFSPLNFDGLSSRANIRAGAVATPDAELFQILRREDGQLARLWATAFDHSFDVNFFKPKPATSNPKDFAACPLDVISIDKYARDDLRAEFLGSILGSIFADNTPCTDPSLGSKVSLGIVLAALAADMASFELLNQLLNPDSTNTPISPRLGDNCDLEETFFVLEDSLEDSGVKPCVDFFFPPVTVQATTWTHTFASAINPIAAILAPSQPSVSGSMNRSLVPAFITALAYESSQLTALSFSETSALLTGVDEGRPIALNMPRQWDLTGVGLKPSADYTRLTDYSLLRWQTQWLSDTALFAFPNDKLLRGAMLRRPFSGSWISNQGRTLRSAESEARLALGKTDLSFFSAGLSRTLIQPWYPEIAPAVLDSARVLPAQVPAVLFPSPYADIDPSFTHRRLTFEVNTSRRSDHDARYRVTWGPFLARLTLAQSHGKPTAAQALSGAVGPGTFSRIATKLQQQLSLLTANELNPRMSGSQLTNVIASAGRLTTGREKNSAALQGPLGGFSARRANPPTAFYGLRLHAGTTLFSAVPFFKAKAQFSYLQGCLSAVKAPELLSWLQLWELSPNAMSRLPQMHASATSMLWLTRALTHVSMRAEAGLALSVRTAGVQKSPEASLPLHNHPLITQLAFFFASSKLGDVSSPSSQTLKSATVSGLLQACSKAARNPRAGFELLHEEVGSIRRLRVTKGIYLPSDIPMHVTCGSKDVIHSWAIPGLGIKIDCIPGFNSHRRVLLRWRGMYWGQCMEVCGRYHHWMPILVRVVHRDIFLSWCLLYLRALDAHSFSNATALTTADLTLALQLSGWLASLGY